MNRSNINAATINAEVLNVVQRAPITSTPWASISVLGHVGRRYPLVSTTLVSTGLTPRVVARAAIAVVAQGKGTLTGQFRVYAKVNSQGIASIGAAGTVYPRGTKYGPVTGQGRAVIWLNAKSLGRLAVPGVGRASSTINQHSYSRIRGSVTSNCYARATISFEIQKQLPFLDLAPAERGILVPYENRTLTVD